MRPLEDCPLIREAGPLWQEATTARFLDAIADGSLPAEALDRWLVQDYHFADALTIFQAIALAKTPRQLREPLMSGLMALDSEMKWFEEMARKRGLDLKSPLHPAGRRYRDFLLRVAYTESYPVLFPVLFAVEVSYWAAWSRLPQQGPYQELVQRWSSPQFGQYVDTLRTLAEQHPHESAQAYFEEVLNHERDFWTMAWEG
ncbi:MAG: TenA family transcriptional regulator [Acidobacteria bacterium]|nr:TenA family transcriptional regulator [Acidobacteriota bacterium]